MSVDVRVILLVEDDKTLYILVELETLGVFMCMYMTVTGASTKRWALTLPKFDEPFGAWFHFENFFGELSSVDVRVILLVEYDKTLYIPCRVGNS